MAFKPHYGQCLECPPDTKRLIVIKAGLCQYHNQQRKKEKKKDKPSTKKNQPRYLPRYKIGQCIKCPPDTQKILAAKGLCKYHNDQKKKEEKSKRVVKLVNKVEEKKSIKWLKKQLDTVFSLFIRERDSNKDGYGKCITCPVIKHYTKMDCGHFITRGAMGIRWNPFNCALQCKKCNGFKQGEQMLFAEAITNRWGPNTAENLQIKRHFTSKLDRFALEFLIKEYTEKLEKIRLDKKKIK